jgi:serine/threonine protein kinase
MYHLKLEGIVYKNLAARNVLIIETKRAKIADFGLAREYENSHVTESNMGYAVCQNYILTSLLQTDKVQF